MAYKYAGKAVRGLPAIYISYKFFSLEERFVLVAFSGLVFARHATELHELGVVYSPSGIFFYITKGFLLCREC